MVFFVLECECDGVSMSAKRCDESDSVVLGDSSSAVQCELVLISGGGELPSVNCILCVNHYH